jgi:hypothetical protein
MKADQRMTFQFYPADTGRIKTAYRLRAINIFAPQVLTPFLLANCQQKNDFCLSSSPAFVEGSGRLYSSYLERNSENHAIT